jgi:hypothetical protein
MGSGVSKPAGAEERDITVPGFWERSPGFANVHEAIYLRKFEVPESFAGGRAPPRFDAAGDTDDVSVSTAGDLRLELVSVNLRTPGDNGASANDWLLVLESTE